MIVQPYGLFTPCLTPQGAPQPCLSPAASEQTAFSDDLQTDLYTPLVTGCPAEGQPCPSAVAEAADVPSGTIFGAQHTGGAAPVSSECEVNDNYCGPYFVAATPDLSHVVLLSAVGLTKGTGAGLYEWAGGRLSFIGKGENEGQAGQVEGSDASRGAHGLSADGSRVIFNGKSENAEHQPIEGLLMRDTSSEESVLLGEHGEFQTASASLSRIFFSEDGDLKVCEIVVGAGGNLQCEVSDLTEGAGVVGDVLGASEDGSYVYFVSAGVLGDGAQHGAVKGADNLYVDHYDAETRAWQPAFVATLASSDSQDWYFYGNKIEFQPTRVSPNGQWLAFASGARLTGYDNRGFGEVYLYHAAVGGQQPSLTCASCAPTGERPTGGGEVPGWEGNTNYSRLQPYQSRYLSDSGRLFFDSAQALVPLDSDGTTDVYEYEPEGVPSGEQACSGASSSGSTVFEPEREYSVPGSVGRTQAGCLALISSGDSGEGSTFLDASEDGSEVFFLTTARLVPQDVDTAPDVYVARECTSASPCLSQPVSPPECDNEASCKASPEPQPSIYGAPPSATFSGPGDLAPPPSPASVGKPKPLTRAQELAKALKACGKDRAKVKRERCEKQARGKYGVKAKKAKKAKKSSNKKGR